MTAGKAMKILFFTSSEEDYLSDGLLIGLRALTGVDCLDYPRREILYSDCSPLAKARVRGSGFTLYGGLLTEIPSDRSHIRQRLERGGFDLVVFSDIWRQFGMFTQWREILDPARTIICDGADTPQVYPHAGLWWRYPSRWLLPRATRGFLYFKREWTESSRFNLWHRLLPGPLRRRLPHYGGLRRIAFSIPEEKILSAVPIKVREFSKHIVDPEVAGRIPGSSTSNVFSGETEYYRDLQASRFGITTKRSGWDCLRHYEIAANGCVPCFRHLDRKPATCAPHGLIPGLNCLSYSSWSHLRHQINQLPPDDYDGLAANAIAWARANSSRNRALEVLGAWEQWTNRGSGGGPRVIGGSSRTAGR